MAYAFVRGNKAAGNVASNVTIPATDFSTCDLITVAVGLYQGGGSPPRWGLTISDSVAGGGAWQTTITSASGSNRHVAVWWKQGTAGVIGGAAQTITIAQGDPQNYTSMTVMGFTGSASSPLDQQAQSAAITTNTTTQSITPSVNDCLLISCAGTDWDGDPVTCKDASGNTNWNANTAAPNQEVLGVSSDHVFSGSSYRILSGGLGASTGAQWFSNSGSPDGAFVVVSFKPDTGGGGGRGLFMPPSLTLGSGGSFFSDGTR